MRPSTRGPRRPCLLVVSGGVAGALLLAASCGPPPGRAAPRPFPDRPVAWHEHDDGHVPRRPGRVSVIAQPYALGIRDFVALEIDRRLALEGPTPADDVNALDEVPCSTWYCPRNHLEAMTPAEVAAGPAGRAPPRPPLTIVEGKSQGVTPGFVVRDARGERYVLKLDPPGRPGLMSGAEVVGNRLAHAAGWYVPGAFAVELAPGDLRLAASATHLVHGYEERPLRREQVADVLARAGRTPEGRLRGVAIPFLEGDILGGFDLIGRHPGDPNDRIPHERRRSLRASWILFAWLNVEDASAGNTLATWTRAPDGRRFVRHYFVDFGAGLGSSSVHPKDTFQGQEHVYHASRSLRALLTLGGYQRGWQRDRAEWEEMVRRYPSLGWLEGESWDPRSFRTGRKIPAHLRMTARDAYWGAKVVTSFTDAQIAAAVAAAAYPPETAARLVQLLRARRDAIGRRFLRAVTAVEAPQVRGRMLCFRDLALTRGSAAPAEVRYEFELRDLEGRVRLRGVSFPEGVWGCVPAADGAGGYRIATIRATVGGERARATRVHVRWRPEERRHVIAGVERDE